MTEPFAQLTDQPNAVPTSQLAAEPGVSGQWVAGALYVDLDTPRARYECLRCRTTEGPVTGRGPVQVFVEQVREIHSGRCPAQKGAADG